MKCIFALFIAAGLDVEILRQEAWAWVRHADKRDDEAIRLLREAADQEDAEGPEQTSIPRARCWPTSCSKSIVRRTHSRSTRSRWQPIPTASTASTALAQAAEKVGQTSDAEKYYADLLRACEGSGSDRPELAHAKQLLAQK
jgi:hypothetical protein